MFIPSYDGNDYTVDELRAGISYLQDELDNRDSPPGQFFLGLEDFQVSSSDPDARYPQEFQKAVVDALHAYDPWAREIISLAHCRGNELIVRYEREFVSNLSFIMKDPRKVS